MATTGVDVKMGVSGLNQFKQDINTAKRTIRNLDEALKLTESTFKRTGDQETYMRDKADLLKQKLEEQKGIVEQCKSALETMKANGVDVASKAYQDMQLQLLNTSNTMLATRDQMDKLGIEAGEAEGDTKGLNDELGKIGQGIAWDNVTNGLKSVTDWMEKAGKKAFSLGKKLLNLSLGAAGWADDLSSEATSWGISPEELYRMEETARIIDTDADAILAARKKLTTAMGKEESKETMGVFEALGIDPTTQHGNIEDVFWQAGEALMSMDDAVKRNEYSMKLFGKNFEELVPLFTAGREEYKKTFDSWSWIGDDSLENLTKLDDSYQKLQSEWENFQRQFEAAMAPVMTAAMETLTTLVSQFNELLSSEEGQEMIKSISDAVSAFFTDLSKIDTEGVVEGIKGAFQTIADGFKWITENKGTVITAIEAIVGAFGVLKLAEAATHVGKIVDGFKTLWNGANKPLPNLTGMGGGSGEAGAAAQTAGTGASAASGSGTASAAGSGLTFGEIAKAGAGLLAIYEGFKWAVDQRTNHREQVRGTEENLLAESEGVEKTLLEYIEAQRELSEMGAEASWEEVGALQDRIDALWQELNGSENGMDAFHGYEDWRQENSYGNEDWIVPDELQATVDKMEQAAAELSGGSSGGKQNSELTSALTGFAGLPSEVAAAVVAGMTGVGLYVDGEALGNILLPYISSGMAGQVLAK